MFELNSDENRFQVWGFFNRLKEIDHNLDFATPLAKCSQHPGDIGRRQSIRVIHSWKLHGLQGLLLAINSTRLSNFRRV